MRNDLAPLELTCETPTGQAPSGARAGRAHAAARVEVDAWFTRGASHAVCEDYAKAGWVTTTPRASSPSRALPYAVVSDGCSSSPLTDVGARLLAHAAVRELEAFGRVDADMVIARARRAARALGLLDEALDATLIMTWCDDDTVRVVAAGDGAVLVGYRSGTRELIVLDDGGAPAYLNYLHRPARARALVEAGYGRRRVTTLRTATDGPRRATSTAALVNDARGLEPHRALHALTLEAAALSFVVVMSDGVSSFERRAVAGAPLPVSVEDIANEVSAFKTTRGAFVHRRMKRFVERDAPRLSLVHHDDLAVAGLAMIHAG